MIDRNDNSFLIEIPLFTAVVSVFIFVLFVSFVELNRNWNNDNSFIFFFLFCFLGKSQHSYSGGRSEQPSQSEGDLADDALSGHEEKIPGGPGLNERELWSLHRAVPGLRRHDPRTSTIRQHYYPEVYINL